MLRGTQSINLDSKGRLAIPTRYREWLLTDCGGQLVCTIDIKLKCLLLYPMPDWEEIELKLRRLSNINEAERRLQRLLLGYASECEMDGSGRILLAGPLRAHAQLDKKVMLVGQLNKFEIWNETIWADQIAADIEAEQQALDLTDRLQGFSL